MKNAVKLAVIVTLSFQFANAQCVTTVNSPTICGGQSTPLIASGASTYSWSPSAGLSSTTGSSVNVSNPSSTTVYTVVGIAGTCTSSATFTVYPRPQIFNASPNTSGCQPVCAFFNPVCNTCNYSWNYGDGATFNGGSNVHCFLNPAIYTVTVIATDSISGCTDTARAYVNVFAMPDIWLDSVTICPGGYATLVPLCNNATITQYNWSPNPFSSNSIGDTVVVHPGSTTIYMVTGITSNGCKDSVTATVSVNCTGIDQIAENNKIIIYPNPANAQFTIETLANEKQTLEILDVNGNVVLHQNISEKTIIDVRDLYEGIYFVKLRHDGIQYLRKLSVIR